MTSLLDIGPLTEEVEIRGVKLAIQGLTAGHIFQLFAEFPEMRKMIDAKTGSPQEVILLLAPDLLAKIIAMVTGAAHNKAVEAKAKTLGAADQLTIIEAVIRLSFGADGIGPFVDRVTKMMIASTESLTGSSAASSNYTTKSPAPFNASLQTDTPAGMRGHHRRVN